MTTKAMGPLAGFRWLMKGINMGRHNAKAVFGGAALILVAALLPTLITMPIQFTLQPGVTGQMLIFAFSIIASMLLLPLVGGYLGLIHASESGRAARATDVFAPYRNGGWLPLVGLGLLLMVAYVLAMVAIAAVAGMDFFSWYMQLMLSAQDGAADPALLDEMPGGLGAALALGFVLWLFLSGVYAISMGQLAIGGRGVLASLGDGFVGGFKNLLPLLVLSLAGLVAVLLFALAMGLLFALVGMLSTMVGSWLLLVIGIPVYIVVLLVTYVVVFGVMYGMWRDVCGGGSVPDAPAEAVVA